MTTPIRFLFTLLCAAIASFLIVLALLPPAHAASSPLQTVPTMTIVIYNNSTTHSIYPVLSTGKHPSDEWLQAQFKVPNSQLGNNPYPINKAYRLYFNPTGAGIRPGGNVTITLPLYTQLVAEPNPKKSDQYIDWWQGGRVYIYASPCIGGDPDTCVSSPPSELDKDYTSDLKSQVMPVGAPPTCPKCQPLLIVSGDGELPSNDPSQLIEYTLGAVKRNKDPYQLDVKNVDYDVSFVDHAFLPAAMEPYNNKVVGYVGTLQEIDPFQNTIKKWLAAEKFKGWPQFVSPQNQILLRIPSALHVFLDQDHLSPPKPVNCEGVGCFVSWPPFEKMRTLFKNCTTNGGSSDPICKKIQTVHNLFVANYNNYKENYRKDFKGTCNQTEQPVPLTEAQMLLKVYGWSPFNNNCTPETNLLQDTPGYKENNSLRYQEVKTDFDELQYWKTGEFDPYVDLIHGTNYLNMQLVYAYSVDDGVGNMQTVGEGLIIAVAGKGGLPNGEPATEPIHVTFGFGEKDKVRFVQYGVCSDSPNQDVNPDHASFDLSTNQLDNCKLSFVDNKGKEYFFTIKKQPPYPEGPPPCDKTKCEPPSDKYKTMIGSCGGASTDWCKNLFGYSVKVIGVAHKKEVNYIVAGAPPQP